MAPKATMLTLLFVLVSLNLAAGRPSCQQTRTLQTSDSILCRVLSLTSNADLQSSWCPVGNDYAPVTSPSRTPPTATKPVPSCADSDCAGLDCCNARVASNPSQAIELKPRDPSSTKRPNDPPSAAGKAPTTTNAPAAKPNPAADNNSQDDNTNKLKNQIDQAQQDTQEERKRRIIAIVVSVVGTVLLVAVICLCVSIRARRKQRRGEKLDDDDDEETQELTSGEYQGAGGFQGGIQNAYRPSGSYQPLPGASAGGQSGGYN